jgi:hypothetical protein
MRIIGIDPGPEQSAVVMWDGAKVEKFGIIANGDIQFDRLMDGLIVDKCAIEMIASYGMPVGAEVFETCVAIGQFTERWHRTSLDWPLRIPRGDIKLHLCRSVKAKDANVRQALIDRFGQPGTKKTPGPLYGITSHCWAALAVAVTAHDSLKCGIGGAE